MDPRVRLKSAAEAQWDADVSAWGFTPEPRSKRRTPSPNRGAAAYDFAREQDPAIPPYDFIQRSIRANYVAVGGPVPGDAIHRAIAANPADFQVWIDGVQVSGPVLDPRHYQPAQPIKLVSAAQNGALPPRLCDLPPRVNAAITRALHERDPVITQAIRGCPGSFRDPPLTVAEWQLCARIHSGVLARTSFETANIPRRLIRLGVAEQLPDSGGLEWGFTPAMARILDAWVQPAQTFGPDRLEGA
jgi:hypothetical protein